MLFLVWPLADRRDNQVYIGARRERCQFGLDMLADLNQITYLTRTDNTVIYKIHYRLSMFHAQVITPLTLLLPFSPPLPHLPLHEDCASQHIA